MSADPLHGHQLLLKGISQYEVDFVIPRLGIDVPVGIDPFLLFKSRDPKFRELHQSIIGALAIGISYLKSGNTAAARQLFHFPEAPEIGLGYTKGSKRGSGMGEFLSSLILETLNGSSAILERGIKHVEELQLISVGIGPDRISDIAAGLIKQFLIEYTQKQASIWKIPLKSDVPVQHIFNDKEFCWQDGYFDLPISPVDGSAILLVPRRIVRTLPWINYDDFVKLEFAPYLRAQAVKRLNPDELASHAGKQSVVSVTRKEIERVSRYIKTKEESAVDAQPSEIFINTSGFSTQSAMLATRLKSISPGAGDAATYQRTILEILNFLFEPELIDGELEVKTIDGTERRDIIFTNDSDSTFWNYVRTEHSSLYLMFETKNTDSIDSGALNQVATYLGDRLGRLGFIVTRRTPNEAQMRKAFSIYNDATPRKIILFLSDEDIYELLNEKSAGKNPMKYIQSLYRKFKMSVQ